MATKKRRPGCLAHAAIGAFYSVVANRPQLKLYRFTMYKIVFFFRHTKFSSSGRGTFIVLSAAGHAGAPPVHDGASVGPGRAPWRVLWAFKVAKPGHNRGVAFHGARAEQDGGKLTL